MFYHDLDVQFLKDGDETKRNFLTGLVTFIVNNFVIYRNNKSRQGIIYFERFRDRSVINYLVKTTLTGIASSLGRKEK